MDKPTRRDSEALFLTYPFRYAHDLANLLFPGYDYDSENDFFYEKDTDVGGTAFHDMRVEGYKVPFKKNDYDANQDIQRDLARLYLDPDAFWEALKLLHYLTEIRFTDTFQYNPTKKEMVREAVEFLDTQGSTVTFRKGNGRKVEIKDSSIISYIRAFLIESPFYDDPSTVRIANLSPSSRRSASYSEKISYEAQALIRLFEKESKPEFDKRGKRYRSPLLLVSRLMYFSDLTNNDEYWTSSDWLKGIMRSYPSPGKDSLSLKAIF